jgi:hypothetical protein
MTIITIDQRGCGLGKTTTNIYKRIQANLKNNQNTLVVVPSINLQNQYKRDLGDITVINSQLYNEENAICNTTTKAALNAIRNNERIVIITHATFIRLPQITQRQNYHLIIDEALDEIITLTEIPITDNDVWQPNYDIENIFQLEENDKKMVELSDSDDEFWYELTQLRIPNDAFLTDSPKFKTITDKNYIHWVTPKGWRSLNQQLGGTTKIINVLSTEVLKGYQSVMIAAAAFNNTKMYHWMIANDIQMTTPGYYEFVPHNANINVFTFASDTSSFSWSNNKRKNIPEIIKKYHACVDANKTDTVLVVRNNGETSKLNDEVRLSHNVHGLNDLMDYTNISLESALIPDPVIAKFVTEHWLYHLETKYRQQEAITHMFCAYLFYQVIMRCKIRSPKYNNEEIRIFGIDPTTCSLVLAYFNDNLYKLTPIDFVTGIYVKKSLGRPKAPESEKQLKAERNKRYYLNKKGN